MKMYSWVEDSITDGIDGMNKNLSTEISHVDPDRNNRDQVKNTECHTELHANYPLIDGGLTYIDQKLKEMEISMEKMKVLVRRIQRIRSQTRSYVPHSRW
jgi:hypothetical protein